MTNSNAEKKPVKILKNIGIYIMCLIILFFIEMQFGFLESIADNANTLKANSHTFFGKGKTNNGWIFNLIYFVVSLLLPLIVVLNSNKIKGFLFFIITAFVFGYSFSKVAINNTANISEKSMTNCNNIEGFYETINEPAKIMITVINNKWVGEIQIRNGMSGEFDSQNSQYGNGDVVGKELFDKGINVGYIDCGTLYTDFGGGQQLEKVK